MIAVEELAELEALLGYSFHRPDRLEGALTHRSRLSELAHEKASEDNEKLEFLGDAVLGLLVAEYLAAMFPAWNEGQLSKSRAKLVSAGSLCGVARRLRLGKHLRLGRGEEKTGGREKPTVLADAYEAVVAAIYLDAGLEAARGFVRRSLLDEALGREPQRLGLPDHKSGLQEYLQARGLPAARYRVAQETGPDHRKSFLVEVVVGAQVLASGEGHNKKEAEQAAARLALQRLRAENG